MIAMRCPSPLRSRTRLLVRAENACQGEAHCEHRTFNQSVEVLTAKGELNGHNWKSLEDCQAGVCMRRLTGSSGLEIGE
jgi:hypothetical protein